MSSKVFITQTAATDFKGCVKFDRDGQSEYRWTVGFRGNVVSTHRSYNAADRTAKKLARKWGAVVVDAGYAAMGIVSV